MKVVRMNLKTLLAFRKDYRGVIKNLIAEHGDKFLVKIFGMRVHVFSDPKFLEYVLVTHYTNFIRPANPIFDPLVNTSKLPPFEVQERWKKFRITILNNLLSENSVKLHTEKLVASTNAHLKKWEKYVDTDEVFYVYPDLERMALENLTYSELDDIPWDIPHIIELIDELGTLALKYETSLTKLAWKFPTPTKRRTNRVIKKVTKVADELIRYALSDDHPQFQVFKEAVKSYGYDYHTPDLEKNVELWAFLRSIAGGYITAGFDTVSRALAITFVYLSQYPEIADNIRAEVKEIVGDGQLTSENVQLLVYTKSVFLESLRFAGGILPVVMRQTLENDNIGDYRIKKNDRILVPIFYMGYIEKYWENPEAFNPTRFLNINTMDEKYRFVYMPFGAGIRGCSGRFFAIIEGIICLALITKQYHLDMVPNQIINSDFPAPIMMRLRRVQN